MSAAISATRRRSAKLHPLLTEPVAGDAPTPSVLESNPTIKPRKSGDRRWNTRRGTRTTPRYSAISTPNSTARQSTARSKGERSSLAQCYEGNNEPLQQERDHVEISVIR